MQVCPFDAVCHSLTTLAVGGCLPHPLSIMGYQSSSVTWIVTFFMFLAGSNFALQYRVIVQGRPRLLLESEEFRLYVAIILILSLLLCVILLKDDSSKKIAICVVKQVS